MVRPVPSVPNLALLEMLAEDGQLEALVDGRGLLYDRPAPVDAEPADPGLVFEPPPWRDEAPPVPLVFVRPQPGDALAELKARDRDYDYDPPPPEAAGPRVAGAWTPPPPKGA